MSKEMINFTEPYRLGVPKGASILVALSGGADSSALLHLLVTYGNREGAKIIAAHVNHGIRGEEYGFEADRDERFCKSLAASLGIKLFVKRLDVPALARLSGRSIETEARSARYSFFAELMQRENIDYLATAHNSDDNIETQIFNLSRGCGTDGMAGIPETRQLGKSEKWVIRPLLRAEKSEIVAYCLENRIDYVTDSTNLETDCTRNAIRHNIIPRLEEIFPKAKKNATRLAKSAAEDSDFILCEAKRFIESRELLLANELTELHPALLKRVLMLAFRSVSDASLESVHLDSLISLLHSERNGAGVSLPDRKQATLTDGILLLSDEIRNSDCNVEQYSIALTQGMNFITDTDFAVSLTVFEGDRSSAPTGYALYARADVKLSSPSLLYAKNRAPGETILDGGLNKKIKKLMCDKKVPLADRDTLPLIYTDGAVTYVPLCSVCDAAKARRGEKPNYTITIYKKSSEAKK